MSKQLLANLPRFDTPQPETPAGEAHSWMQDLGSPAEISDFSSDFSAREEDQGAEIVAIEDHQPAESEAEAVENGEADIAALNELNVSLSDVIAQLGRDAQTQAIVNVQAIAAQLFPTLADAFLADELSSHLPNLIPKLAPEVEISVPASLLPRLQSALERTHALPPNCRFVEAVAGQSGNAIRIIWPNGGYDFDFNTLLADCMTRLNSQASKMES